MSNIAIYRSSRHIALDVETTGLSPRFERIIEIGAVVVEDGLVAEEFHSLINIGTSIPKSAQAVHGITDRMLKGQPEPETVMSAFHRFAGDGILIAHNARFDLAFLRHEFARIGLALNNRALCTLELSRRHFPRLKDHRLETVARHVLGVLGDYKLHRALDDAKLVAQIWIEMAGK